MIALLLFCTGILLTALEMSREKDTEFANLRERILAAVGPAAILFLGAALPLASFAGTQALVTGIAGIILAFAAFKNLHRHPMEKC